MQQIAGGSMSAKVRVYEVAKQLNLDPKQVVGLFQAIGVAEVRNHMSSVEPEAVERVKRHLEKQRTHDVVEERIRPGVLKRRAVAKAASSMPAPADSPSAPSIPVAVPSVRALEDVSGPPPETNGHPVSEPLAARDDVAAPSTPARSRIAPESGRLPIPEDRHSSRVLEPVSIPRDRASTRSVVTPEPVAAPAPVMEAPPPAPAPVVERLTDDTVAAAAPAPVQEPSIAPPPPPLRWSWPRRRRRRLPPLRPDRRRGVTGSAPPCRDPDSRPRQASNTGAAVPACPCRPPVRRRRAPPRRSPTCRVACSTTPVPARPVHRARGAMFARPVSSRVVR